MCAAAQRTDSDTQEGQVGGSPTIFLLNDTQIQEETMVENISNLLNSGEVPNMLSQEDIAAAVEAVRPAAKADRNYQKQLQLAAGPGASRVDPTPAHLFQYWKRRVRANLHVVLAFSPVGESFRTRLRQFPSIINCCTIDSFSEWPADALAATAEKLLGTKPMDSSNRNDAKAVKDQLRLQGAGLPKGSVILKEVVDMCMFMHESTKNTATQFLSELKRHYHVTPTSYLEMLQTFKDLLAMKKLEVLESKER